MPKYAVEISDEASVELDVAPGAPALRRVTLEWEVPRAEIAKTLGWFGGSWGGDAFSRVSNGSWTRVVPLTRDGERVGKALLRVWEASNPPDPHDVAREESERLGAAPGGGRW